METNINDVRLCPLWQYSLCLNTDREDNEGEEQQWWLDFFLNTCVIPHWVSASTTFPLLPLHFSALLCQPCHQWTAYQAGTNHIWLLSVCVSYTLGASRPPATAQPKKDPICYASLTGNCWMWFWWGVLALGRKSLSFIHLPHLVIPSGRQQGGRCLSSLPQWTPDGRSQG